MTEGCSYNQWQEQEAPQNSTFTTGTNNLVTRSLKANLGLQQGFSTGTNYALTYTSTWHESNSVKSAHNPSTSGNLGLTVTRPRLRGFGAAVNRRWIRIARNDQKPAQELLKNTQAGVEEGTLAAVELKESDVSLAELMLLPSAKSQKAKKAIPADKRHETTRLKTLGDRGSSVDPTEVHPRRSLSRAFLYRRHNHQVTPPSNRNPLE